MDFLREVFKYLIERIQELERENFFLKNEITSIRNLQKQKPLSPKQ